MVHKSNYSYQFAFKLIQSVNVLKLDKMCNNMEKFHIITSHGWHVWYLSWCRIKLYFRETQFNVIQIKSIHKNGRAGPLKMDYSNLCVTYLYWPFLRSIFIYAPAVIFIFIFVFFFCRLCAHNKIHAQSWLSISIPHT